jgi:hypothetical protein
LEDACCKIITFYNPRSGRNASCPAKVLEERAFLGDPQEVIHPGPQDTFSHGEAPFAFLGHL